MSGNSRRNQGMPQSAPTKYGHYFSGNVAAQSGVDFFKQDTGRTGKRVTCCIPYALSGYLRREMPGFASQRQYLSVGPNSRRGPLNIEQYTCFKAVPCERRCGIQRAREIISDDGNVEPMMRHVEADRLVFSFSSRLRPNEAPRVSNRCIHVFMTRDALPGNVKRGPMIDRYA